MDTRGDHHLDYLLDKRLSGGEWVLGTAGLLIPLIILVIVILVVLGVL